MKKVARFCLFLASLSASAIPPVTEYTLKGVNKSTFSLTQWQNQYRLNGVLYFQVNIRSDYYNNLRMYSPLIIPNDAPESEIIKLIYETFHKKVIVNKRIMLWE